jgi:hypothetical protein
LNEAAVQNAVQNPEVAQGRVRRVGQRVAAKRVRSSTRAGGLGGRRGIVTVTVVAPGHRNGGGEDAAGRGESQDEGEEGFEELHCG